jgi:hypothetical protein
VPSKPVVVIDRYIKDESQGVNGINVDVTAPETVVVVVNTVGLPV